MILVSNTEPPHVRELGKVSTAPEDHGCDVLIRSRRHLLGIQRKVFPQDLLASLEDGRLSRQLVKMAELDRAAIVLIGYPSWTRDGELVFRNWSGRKWTFDSIWGALASAALLAGVGTFWVRDEGEFIDLVKTLEGWNKRDRHSTVRTSSRPKAKGWGMSEKVQQAHFLQGLPGIGPEIAERIIDQFGGLPLKWRVSKEEMLGVEGVGKAKVKQLGEMVEYEND